ncbi:HAD family hydrolase [Actinotalea sp. Marseille-Q4924]|uniref:HAD family hydrolase n=1 Tax=Actinotalea sp. Marseille-Q4924 TaxID=2866571 RepID=UPI001CE42A05|nr:HAD family hydrolase [Actinotalea sp. Marseille-Q4924]
MPTTPESSPGAVLLDIDGTLVDSNYLHVHAWVQAFAEVDRPVDAWRVHRAIGMGSSLLLAALLGDAVHELGDRAKKRHTEHYAELAELQRPFPGARELVRAIADRGARTVLATSAGPEELERLLAVLDVEDALTGVTSAKDVEEAKPDPDLVLTALEVADVAPGRAVLVGDTVWDVQAAERAGVRRVGVLSGGVSEAELRDAGAVAVYRDVAALLDDLDDSPLAQTW